MWEKMRRFWELGVCGGRIRIYRIRTFFQARLAFVSGVVKAKSDQERRNAMTKRLGWLTAALVAGWMTTGVAQGQDLPQIFHINPARSSVTFHIPASGEAANGKPNETTNGSFKVKASSLRFVQADKSISGQVVIAAASERSGDAGRDKAIRSKVLEAKQFPTMTFAPSRYDGTISRTGTTAIQMMGVLTIDGKPHEMTVPVDVQSNGFELSATARIVVPVRDWGMTDLGAAGLPGASQVEVDLKLVGYVSPRN
jgi:polyisoprenoid-binding protein YceI